MRVRGRTDGRECEREQTALRSDGRLPRAGPGRAGPGPRARHEQLGRTVGVSSSRPLSRSASESALSGCLHWFYTVSRKNVYTELSTNYYIIFSW